MIVQLPSVPQDTAQRKRASPRGEAGTSGFLSVSDSDRRVPAELGQESQASSCLRKGTPLASRVAQGVSGPSSSCVWNPRVFADDARGWQCPFVLCLHPQGCLRRGVRASGPSQERTGESGAFGMWPHPRGSLRNVQQVCVSSPHRDSSIQTAGGPASVPLWARHSRGAETCLEVDSWIFEKKPPKSTRTHFVRVTFSCFLTLYFQVRIAVLSSRIAPK